MAATPLRDLLAAPPSFSSDENARGVLDYWGAVLERIRSHPHEASSGCGSVRKTTGGVPTSTAAKKPNLLHLALEAATAQSNGEWMPSLYYDELQRSKSCGTGGVSPLGKDIAHDAKYSTSVGPVQVISALICLYPWSAFEAAEMDHSPLYYACARGAPPDVVRAILGGTKPFVERSGEDPLICDNVKSRVRVREFARLQALKEERYYRKLPLHVATDSEVARLLLEAYPEGVQHRTVLGHLPLHRAAANRRTGPSVIRVLIRGWKRMTVAVNDVEKCCCCNHQFGVTSPSGDDDKDRVVLEAKCNQCGCSRLHLRCSCFGSLVLDVHGKTPLGVLWDDLSLRLRTCGGVLREDDSEGRRYWEKIVAIAEEARPVYSATSPDSPSRHSIRSGVGGNKERNEGRAVLVLHSLLTLGGCCPVDLFRHAVAAHPDQVHIRDEFGRTPLHIAASNGSCSASPLDLVRLLLAASPSAAGKWDRDGMLPLHCAARAGLPAAALREIWQAHPDALHERGGAVEGELYPFAWAALSLSSFYNGHAGVGGAAACACGRGEAGRRSDGEAENSNGNSECHGVERVNNTYFLIREAPELVAVHVTGKSCGQKNPLTTASNRSSCQETEPDYVKN